MFSATSQEENALGRVEVTYRLVFGHRITEVVNYIITIFTNHWQLLNRELELKISKDIITIKYFKRPRKIRLILYPY